MGLQKALRFLDDLFGDDDPAQARYDPVHLGAVCLVVMAAAGCLYWLLWTLLVYEGGLYLKVRALLQLLFTSKTLKDLGYEGAHEPGAFEGTLGNLGALLLLAAVLAALHRLYHEAARKHRSP